MDRPFVLDILPPQMLPSHYDQHTIRKLSSMKGQYLDTQAYTQMLTTEDKILYEVFEIRRPEISGELLHGISIIHPGKVGNEYFMTKGHFHAVIDTAEIYYCLKGEGKMVMETPEGDWAVEDFCPSRILYVPPRWAHRSVNIGSEDLIFLYVYPGYSGHNYGTIEQNGFRKLILDIEGKPQIVDNPRWQAQ